MGSRIQLLDCTLRDGGLGLEDAFKNQIVDMGFSMDDMDRMIEHLSKSNIDIIEIGSIELSNDDKRRFVIYQDIKSISEKKPDDCNENQMYVALYRGPDTLIEDIPEWSPKMVDGVRVILRYSELQKSLDFCEALSNKGYKVFVQPMLTMRYTEAELQQIIDAANRMDAYALYFVDSYGYMQTQDVLRLFSIFDKGLNKNIRIGFHAHNNMNLAFSNVLSFIGIETERSIIVDSCAIGMGQGAGNLQTEVIAHYMNANYSADYNYKEILEVCELVERFNVQNVWGYSVTRLLPAIHKTAYKYAVALRNQYGLSYADIDCVFRNMPEELRHRYTPENTLELLQRLK